MSRQSENTLTVLISGQVLLLIQREERRCYTFSDPGDQGETRIDEGTDFDTTHGALSIKFTPVSPPFLSRSLFTFFPSSSTDGVVFLLRCRLTWGSWTGANNASSCFGCRSDTSSPVCESEVCREPICRSMESFFEHHYTVQSVFTSKWQVKAKEFFLLSSKLNRVEVLIIQRKVTCECFTMIYHIF